MLNQLWQGWDPCRRIYHIQIFISFRTLGSFHTFEAVARNPDLVIAGSVAVFLWSRPQLGHNLLQDSLA